MPATILNDLLADEPKKQQETAVKDIRIKILLPMRETTILILPSTATIKDLTSLVAAKSMYLSRCDHVIGHLSPEQFHIALIDSTVPLALDRPVLALGVNELALIPKGDLSSNRPRRGSTTGLDEGDDLLNEDVDEGSFMLNELMVSQYKACMIMHISL